MRSPVELDAAIIRHQDLFKDEPKLISISAPWHERHSQYFAGRVHTLCCGKGHLYCGIPCVITTSPYVEDFLVCY